MSWVEVREGEEVVKEEAEERDVGESQVVGETGDSEEGGRVARIAATRLLKSGFEDLLEDERESDLLMLSVGGSTTRPSPLGGVFGEDEEGEEDVDVEAVQAIGLEFCNSGVRGVDGHPCS